MELLDFFSFFSLSLSCVSIKFGLVLRGRPELTPCRVILEVQMTKRYLS